VRYSHLRPDEFDERLEKFPVCFLPMGSLEWHYLHLPLGTDGLEAEALCVRTAQKSGGIVLPPVTVSITGRYRSQFDPQFGDSKKFYRNIKISNKLFEELFNATVEEMIGVGFKMIVIFNGHGTAGVYEPFAYRWHENRNIATILTPMPMFVVDRGMTAANDHAAFLETSLTSAIAPDSVDLSKLEQLTGPYDLGNLKQAYSMMDSDRQNASPDPENIIKKAYIGGLDPRLGAGAEMGKIFIETITDRAAKYIVNKYRISASGDWPEFDFPFSESKCWEKCPAFKNNFIQPDSVQRCRCGVCSEASEDIFEVLEERYGGAWLKNTLEFNINLVKSSPHFWKSRTAIMKKLLQDL